MKECSIFAFQHLQKIWTPPMETSIVAGWTFSFDFSDEGFNVCCRLIGDVMTWLLGGKQWYE